MEQTEALMQAFKTLKEEMKVASVAAIEADDFAKSRELTSLMEDLVALHRRATVLFDDGQEEAITEEKSGAEDRYPRFFRRGNVLVKEGLRRDGQSTYEQKMPQQVYDEVLGALRRIRTDQAEFHAPDVIKQVSCPDYHIYIMLNLLQESGHLDSPQRGLYRFRRRNDPEWATHVWENTRREKQVEAN